MEENLNNSPYRILTFTDYLFIVRNHLLKIVLITVLGTLISIYLTYTSQPIYKSTVTVMVREKPGSAMIMDFGGTLNRDRMNNEIQKIKSRSVGKNVVKQFWNSERRNNMFLFGTRRFYPKGERIRKIFREVITLGLYDSGKEDTQDYLEEYSEEIGERFSGKVINNIVISNQRLSDLIEITYSSVNADEAKRVANMIAKVYQNLEKEWGNEDASLTVTFLSELLKKQEYDLTQAEEIVKNYKLKNSIYDMNGDAGSLALQLTLLETELYNINADINIRSQKINLFSSKLSQDEKDFAEKIANNIDLQVEALRLEISSLESQMVQSSTFYGKEHIAAKELATKIMNLKIELNKKVKILISGGVTFQDPIKARQSMITDLLLLESEIIGLNLKKEETKKLKSIYVKKISKVPNKQLEFSRLQRDVNVLNENYTYLRKKLEESKIKLASTSGKVQIIDQARRPSKPVSPNHKQDIILGIILSLGTSFLLIFLIEILDNTIKTPEDIKIHNLNVLGIIPSIGNEKLTKFQKKNQKGKIQRRLITREDPRSPVSEAYRSLRTSMLYTDIDQETKSILVSSAGPGEGKTTTVANMAITYANLGKKTLLIDTDLRRPVVHKVLELEKEPGITDFLTGNSSSINSIVKKTEISNLFAITSGIIPPNPSELLGSKKMADLIKKLEKEWDIILFDSPPLVAVTDATMVSKEIDKIIIVVKVSHTDKKAFSHTVQSLRSVNAPLSGVVLNAVTHKNSYGSYYYYYQYYHYYGDNKESDKV